MKKSIIILTIFIYTITLVSCATIKENPNAAKGACIGSIFGFLQALINKDKPEDGIKKILIGAIAGGAMGSLIDAQERKLRKALEQSNSAVVEREGNLIKVLLKGDFLFNTNSFIVKPGLYSEIDRIAKILVMYPKTKIVVEGHTDSRGSESYNMNLSKNRAEAVQNLFIQKGVNHNSISILALGETQPRLPNDTPEGRQMNRRVEVKISHIDEQHANNSNTARFTFN